MKIRALALMAGLAGRVGDPFAVVHYVNELLAEHILRWN